MNSPKYKLFKRSALGLVLFVSLATVGCGGNEFTEVIGKVTIDGAPVTAGSVYFVSTADASLSGGAQLNADGTFKANVPVGKMKFAVQTRAFKPKSKEPNPGAKGSSGPPGKGGPPAWATSGPKKNEAPVPTSEVLAKTGSGGGGGPAVGTTYTAIPDKYETPTTSGMEFDIKRGANDLGEIKLSGK